MVFMSKNYTSVIAELYDYCSFFSKFRNESNYARDFYLPIIDKYHFDNVLELGTATGNLTIPIAEKGISIDSVDISKDMHSIVKEKIANNPIRLEDNINLITDDVFNMVLSRKYDMVIMPDNFLSVMSSYEEQSKLIELVGKILNTNGILIFDVSPPNQFLIEGKNHNFITRTITPSKQVYIVKCEIVIDEKKHLNYQNFDICRINNKLDIMERHKTQIIYRYLYKEEILKILNVHNFEVLEARDEIVSGVKEYAFIVKYRGVRDE